MTEKSTTLPNFNPSNDPAVTVIKGSIENAINVVKELQGGTRNYDPRCAAIALTKLEEASMWAVKGLFV